MKDKTMSLIRVLGLINIIVGIGIIVSGYKWVLGSGLWQAEILRQGAFGEFSVTERVLIFVLSLIVIPILPAAKIITGGGLLVLKKWAYRLTLLVVTVDFCIRFFSAVNYCATYYLFIEVEQAGFPLEEISMRLSMLPTYIIALFDLLIIAILSRETARNHFKTSCS